MQYLRSQMSSIFGLFGFVALSLGLLSWPSSSLAQTSACAACNFCMEPNWSLCTFFGACSGCLCTNNVPCGVLN
jgi:hypothetical protein